MPTTTANTRGLSRTEFIGIIAALMGLNALAIDVMIPALPYMGEALGVGSENDRQLVLPIYMLGFGITQLFFGPLSDRFGRRAPLLVGLVIYLIAAFGAAFSPNFGMLLFLRFVQGMGAAGTRVIAQSIVRDCFSGRAMAEVMSLVFMVFMIMPVIAPSIGQVILLVGPWWAIFMFMGGLATFISAWAYFRLPETLDEENRRPLSYKSVTGGFITVFTNRSAISYSIAGTFLFGALFGFITASQQIYVGIYKMGVWFPLAFAGMGGIMSISSYINSRVVGRFGMRRISHGATIVFTIGGFLLFGLTLLGPVPMWQFFMIIAVVMFAFGWAISNMNSLSMEPLGKVAGTASAVFGFIQTTGGAIIGGLVARQFDGTLMPMAASYAIMGTIALGFILFAEKGKLFGVSPEYED